MNSRFSCEEIGMGVKLIQPFYMEDERGYFLKNIEKDVFKEWGLDAEINETFYSLSKKGVIRGLHFQTKEPQAKIVSVLKGEVKDVIVDLRKGSETFGKYLAVNLSEQNRNVVWIPKGFAHGFEVLSNEALVSYTCVGKYLNEYDNGIVWKDEALAIEWHTKEPIVSKKDDSLMTFEKFCSDFGGLDIEGE